MSQIVKLPKDNLSNFVVIISRAFPNMRYDIQDKRDSLFERLQDTYDDPIRNLYGLFKVGELLGGMMVYDFTMNFRGTMIHAGGAGCS